MSQRPNVLFIMTDQQRFDTIAALGNAHTYTPNLDRLVRRGVSFTSGYSPCPVCVPARYCIRSGCLPARTGWYSNGDFFLPAGSPLPKGQSVFGTPARVEDRCGPYLARAMGRRGYRTFGIGKSHTYPTYEDIGFDIHLHGEEMYGSEATRDKDAYASWIKARHPEFNFLEHLMGERTEMYYVPQTSALPPQLGMEYWAAERAIEQIRAEDDRPYFGFVSFVGPHPPCAPPIPFNRLHDPDRMPLPVCGDLAVDHMDDQIPCMNQLIWADDISPAWARILKSRYYGEITYIDHCLGRILDAVERSPEGDNTLICFFADHGDHLGDHHAWQKESYFDVSCRVPFLVSWPKRFPADCRRDDLVSLLDLFGLATAAAGEEEVRDGISVTKLLTEGRGGRELLHGMYGKPGASSFKVMVLSKLWKYIFMANGGREQLFSRTDDPCELKNRVSAQPAELEKMRRAAAELCASTGLQVALDGGRLKAFPFVPFLRAFQGNARVYQFETSRAPNRFPEHPASVVEEFKKRGL